MKRTSNPCAATCADGSKCGRRAPLGEQFCHLHKAQALGQPVGKPFQPTQRTPKEIVEKLLTDSDPSVRLRAVEMWQKHFESQKLNNGRDYRDLLSAMTDDEKAALREALDWIAAIKESVYARNPDLEPDARTLERRRQREETPEAAQLEQDTAREDDGSDLDEPESVSASKSDNPTVDENRQRPVDLPFEPLDGQLTADDVRRLYDATDVEEIAPGQFRFTQEEEM